jgi:hypothetical protein
MPYRPCAPKDCARVPFSGYAKSLAANVFQAAGLPRKTVSLELAIGDLTVPVDKAIPCGLPLIPSPLCITISEYVSGASSDGFGR